MMEWTTACIDWEQRIVAKQPIVKVGALFPKEAEYALNVFNALKMVDVLGSPYMSEVIQPWVYDFLNPLFGSYDPNTGRRLINEYMLLVSKKNGKSLIAGAVMLTALILNWRQSGEYIILSPTKEIAENSFKPIRDMILADDELSDLLHVQQHIKTITHRQTGATLKVVAADSDTVTGKKATGVFVDELHEFGKKSKAANMLLEATGGLTSRPEGFVIYATTQSEEPPAGVFKTKLDYARKVRNGEIDDPKFLPILYEFPPSMIKSKAYLNLKNAYITNPNWGVSVDEGRITQLYNEAVQSGDEQIKNFSAKHLNVEIGMNLRSDRWAGADHWESQGKKLTLDGLLKRSDVVTIGIDGGGLDDLLGAAVIGREKDTGNWLHWGKAWAHESVLERRKEIAPRLKDFERDGDLMIVKNVGDDVRDLAGIIKMIYDQGLLPEERAIGIDQIGLSFEEIFDDTEIPSDLLIGISQGYRLGGTIMTVERKLAEGTFIHGASPMMAWCVSNCRVEQRSNSILITKQASGKAKIDPVMALLDAAQLMALNPSSSHKKYEMFFI